MSNEKEMTAEEYLKNATYNNVERFGDAVTPESCESYGDLRAKEAVREFAEELMRRRNLIMSEPDGIVRETMIANLLVDLFLDHQKKQQEGKGE